MPIGWLSLLNMENPMTTPTNPTTFSITDPTFTADGVTTLQVQFGQTSGKYSLTATVPVADITVANGGATVSGALSDLEKQLAPGNWFAIAIAINATGASKPSPEIEFTVVPPVPSAPSFSVQ